MIIRKYMVNQKPMFEGSIEEQLYLNIWESEPPKSERQTIDKPI